MATVLSLLRGGEIFQYEEQLGGQLTAPIEPKADGAPNSNASPEPFGWHCDDSIMPARFRVEEIALLSVFNPEHRLCTHGGSTVKKLSTQARETLMQPRFSIKAPNAFSFDKNCWIDCVSVLALNADGKVEIAYPSYNTKPTWDNDGEAQSALNEVERTAGPRGNRSSHRSRRMGRVE